MFDVLTQLKRLSVPLAVFAVSLGMAGGLLLQATGLGAAENAVEIPAPVLDPKSSGPELQTAVIAGGSAPPAAAEAEATAAGHRGYSRGRGCAATAAVQETKRAERQNC